MLTFMPYLQIAAALLHALHAHAPELTCTENGCIANLFAGKYNHGQILRRVQGVWRFATGECLGQMSRCELRLQIIAKGYHGILGSDCVLREKAGLHIDRN